MSAKKVGLLASIKEQDVIEDELEVRIGRLITTCQARLDYCEGVFTAYLLDLVYNIIAHPFRVEGK